MQEDCGSIETASAVAIEVEVKLCLLFWKGVKNSVVNSDFPVNRDSLSAHQTESAIAKNFVHKCD